MVDYYKDKELEDMGFVKQSKSDKCRLFDHSDLGEGLKIKLFPKKKDLILGIVLCSKEITYREIMKIANTKKNRPNIIEVNKNCLSLR